MPAHEITLPPDKDEAICTFLMRWCALEESRGHESFLDVNLIRHAPLPAYDSRAQALEALKPLMDDPDIMNHPALAARMRSHEVLLRARLGQYFPFESLISHIHGYTPPVFDDQAFALQETRTKQAFDAISADFARGYDALEAIATPIAEDRLADYMRGLVSTGLDTIEELCGRRPDFDLNISGSRSKAYWHWWTGGHGKNFTLRWNRHRVPRHFRETSAFYVAHEIMGHMCQLAFLHDAINEGALPRCLGLYLVHDPSMYQAEGLAQSIWMMLEDEIYQSDMILAIAEMEHLEDIAKYRAFHMACQGKNIEQAIDMRDKVSHFSDKQAELESMGEALCDPVSRCYEIIYAPALKTFRRVAESSDHEAARSFYADMLTGWYLPREIDSWAAAFTN